MNHISNVEVHLKTRSGNVNIVQCTKLDIISSELLDFDIQAFPKTWLTPDILKDDRLLDSLNKLKSKDCPTDSHGDVMVYVKMYYTTGVGTILKY